MPATKFTLLVAAKPTSKSELIELRIRRASGIAHLRPAHLGSAGWLAGERSTSGLRARLRVARARRH